MRIAVIGGGPAALTAAFELTAPGAGEHQVTIFQPGWRLGGKCASGRNHDEGRHDRIEEHGLHVLFGCYDNAFDLMRRCYEELGRTADDCPLHSVETAFEGIDVAVLWQCRDGEWTSNRIAFPRTRIPPIDFHSFAVQAVEMAADSLARVVRGDGGGAPDLPGIADLVVDSARVIQQRLAELFGDVPQASGRQVLNLLEDLQEGAEEAVPASRRSDGDAIFLFDNLDLLVALLRGVWEERLLEIGFDAINDRDLADWLVQHGATIADDPIEWPALLRGVYCGCFAFQDGDPKTPRIAAGRAIQGAIRCLFGYRDSVLNRMLAGMGDALVAPLYEVLVARGVQVRFFEAVTALRPNADGTRIAEIDVVAQLGEAVDGYEPLFDVPYGAGSLRCWPSEPLWDRLGFSVPKEVEQAFRRLEFEINPFDAEPETLRVDEHFDAVVLAVPPDVQKEICGALRTVDGDYATMLEQSASVVTQGAQLWLQRTASELGQAFESQSLMSSYVEPLDTYCDMAHLVPAECWPPEIRVEHIAYLCGVLPHEKLDSQAAADAAAQECLDDWLTTASGRLWVGFDRTLLSTTGSAAAADDPLADQYCRGNWAPTERYVLSLPGTIDARLHVDGTVFGNLVLAGDWTRNGFDAGCLEAAITSGMLAARALHPVEDFREIAGLNGPAAAPSRVTGPAMPRATPPATAPPLLLRILTSLPGTGHVVGFVSMARRRLTWW